MEIILPSKKKFIKYIHTWLTFNCRTIMEGLKKKNLNCIPFRKDDDTSFDQFTIEHRISNSVATVVILTDQCLEKKDILFALQAAAWCYHPRTSRVILVSNVNQ